jgi:putative spermidine/putrescine transport system permease protein
VNVEGMATTQAPDLESRPRRLGVSAWLYRHPRARLAGLMSAPVAWLALAYFAALFGLLATSFYTVDPFTSEPVRAFTWANYEQLFSNSAYLKAIGRTVGIAAAVTIICTVLGVPMGFFIAKVVPRRWRGLMVALVVTPLWASYLVKVYSWKAMLQPGSGVVDWLLGPLGLSGPGYGVQAVVITLSYLWLPFMILPVFGGLDRLPDSMLDASADLGGKTLRTLRSVVLPLVYPSIVAGSIFTFSLSLGDYITVQIVGSKTQMLGSIVYSSYTTALPFAAAMATIPVIIMVFYLAGVRRTGALDNL